MGEMIILGSNILLAFIVWYVYRTTVRILPTSKRFQFQAAPPLRDVPITRDQAIAVAKAAGNIPS